MDGAGAPGGLVVTVLVTGGTGFIGSAVVRALLARGETVRVLARANSDRSNLGSLNVEFVEGDLNDAASLVPAVRGCDGLYHVAADYRLWIPRPDEVYRTNVEGTHALLRAAAEAGVGRIVYTSSVATLGIDTSGAPADETTPVGIEDMIGHYKRSKYLAEAAVRELAAGEDVPVVIVNPSAPVGPRDIRPTPTGKMVLDAAAGRMPAYVDTGLNLVHVDDVAAGHLLAFDRGRVGERYILGGENLMLREILGRIAAMEGRQPPSARLPIGPLMPVAWAMEQWARLSGVDPMMTRESLRMARKVMFFTAAKAERDLGYRARPADDALADAVAWFREAGYLPSSAKAR